MGSISRPWVAYRFHCLKEWLPCMSLIHLRCHKVGLNWDFSVCLCITSAFLHWWQYLKLRQSGKVMKWEAFLGLNALAHYWVHLWTQYLYKAVSMSGTVAARGDAANGSGIEARNGTFHLQFWVIRMGSHDTFVLWRLGSVVFKLFEAIKL